MHANISSVYIVIKTDVFVSAFFLAGCLVVDRFYFTLMKPKHSPFTVKEIKDVSFN